MLTFDSKSRAIFAKYKATDYLERTVETLTNDKFIRKQLEHQQINVNTITSEWASLKSIIGRWGKKEFPPNDLSSIGKRVADHDNLFALIDYFLCQNVSAADAERGFSVVKETKTLKCAVLSNKYLSNQSCCRVLRWTDLTLTGLMINGLGLQSADVERQTPNPAAMPVCNPV